MAATITALEKHYTPQELAELWSVDESTIRRLFQDVEGVLKIRRSAKGKREYSTIRIPQSVACREHEQRSRRWNA